MLYKTIQLGHANSLIPNVIIYNFNALLSTQTSRKELLALDFEGILKYFRVSLPKKYRVEDVSHDLINTAIALKVNCVHGTNDMGSN